MKKTSGNHRVTGSCALVLATGCLVAIEGGADTAQARLEPKQQGGQVSVDGSTPVKVEHSNNLIADNTKNQYQGSQVTNFDVHGNPGAVYQGNTFNTYNNNYYRC
jgi:hypothetical protein